jgi:hypothetical protein
MLRDSSITDEFIRARGYRTVTSAEELLELGFSDYQAKRVPGLLVPMHGVDGKPVSYQFRPDKPRIREGKPIKYETRAGARNVLDVSPMMQPLLQGAEHVLFTEGAKKADSMASKDYVVVMLSGVWNWVGRKDDGSKGPLKDFDSVNWQGKTCWIVFDSDARTNPDILLAAARLSDLLRSRGAVAWVVFPPAGSDGEKVGVDDYIAAGGDWDALFAGAQQITETTLEERLDEKSRAVVERLAEKLERLRTAPGIDTPANSLLEQLRKPHNPEDPCKMQLAGHDKSNWIVLHKRCEGGRCPRCAAFYITKNVRRVLETLGHPETVQIVRLDSKKDSDRARKRLGKGVRVLQHDDSMNYLPVDPSLFPAPL